MDGTRPTDVDRIEVRLVAIRRRLTDAEAEIVELRRETAALAGVLTEAKAAHTPAPATRAIVRASASESAKPTGMTVPPAAQATPSEADAAPSVRSAARAAVPARPPAARPTPSAASLPQPAATRPAARAQTAAGEAASTPRQAPPPPVPPESGGADSWNSALEARIGADWVLRVGLVAIVIGFGFLARWIHPQLAPLHKVLAGYVGAAALFGVGWFCSDRLRGFARPVMAAGLALGFFVSFAAHFVPPMACMGIAPSLVLMGLFTLALFGAAERWRSEPTAGLAIVLGHVGVLVSSGQNNALSLVAVAFLSVAAVALLLRHRWVALGALAVPAAFLSHALWVLRDPAIATPQAAFWINFGFFSSYYSIFTVADLLQGRRGVTLDVPATRWRQVASRALGPASLVLYATFAAGVFALTDVYWQRLDLFLFGLAAVQVGLFALHRRAARQDAPFLGSMAAVLAGLGLVAAFDGVTLSLALAFEALVLHLLARRLRIWFLAPLAELAMLANLLQLMQSSTAQQVVGFPGFVAGLAMAAVWSVKARLLETADALADVANGAPLQRWRHEFARVLPPLALAQGVGGGFLAAWYCRRFLEPSFELIGLVAGALVLVAAAAGRRSAAWFAGGCTVLVASGLTVVGHRAMPAGVLDGTGWLLDNLAVTLLAFAGCLGLLLARRRDSAWLGLAGGVTLAGAALFALPAAGVGRPQPGWLPLWIVTPLGLWIEAGFGRAFGMRSTGAREGLHLGRFGKRLRAAFARVSEHLGPLWAIGAALLSALLPLTVLGRAAGPVWIAVALVPLVAAYATARDRAGLALAVPIQLLLAVLLSYLAPDSRFNGGPWVAWTLLVTTAVVALAWGHMRPGRAALSRAALGAMSLSFVAVPHVFDSSAVAVNRWLWLPAFALVWAALDRVGRRTEPARGGIAPANVLARPAAAAAAIASLLLAGIVAMEFGSPADSVLYAAIGLALLAAAALRRSDCLGAAYVVTVPAGFVLATATGLFPGGEHSLLSACIGVAWLAGAWFVESDGSVPARVGAGMAGLPATLLLTDALGSGAKRLLGVPEATLASGMLLATVVFIEADRTRARVLQAIGGCFAALALLQTLTLPFAGRPLTGGYLACGAIAALLALAFERVARGHVPQDRNSIALRYAGVIACALTLMVVLLHAPQMRAGWTTIGWSLTGLGLMTLGFLWRSPLYRLTALALLELTVLRVVLVDVAHLETFYRMMAFLGLGACLVAVSLLYSRYREQLKRWL